MYRVTYPYETNTVHTLAEILFANNFSLEELLDSQDAQNIQWWWVNYSQKEMSMFLEDDPKLKAADFGPTMMQLYEAGTPQIVQVIEAGIKTAYDYADPECPSFESWAIKALIATAGIISIEKLA